MRTSLKTLIAATALVAGFAAAPALYAHGPENTPGAQGTSMSQGNMMGQSNMMGQGNATGQGNMMGMMNMMQQMDQMMETHTKTMQAMMKAHGIAPQDTTQPNQE